MKSIWLPALAVVILATSCQKSSTTSYRNTKSLPQGAAMEETPNMLPNNGNVNGATPEPPKRVTNNEMVTPEQAKAQEEEEKKNGIINKIQEATGIGDSQKCSDCDAKLPGDIVHRKSGPSSAFVGHSGIFAGNDMFMHVTTKGDDEEKAMAIVPTDVFFTSGSKVRDSYGAKRPKSKPDGLKQEEFEILKKYTQELIDVGVKYDLYHLNQKGKFYSQVQGEPAIRGPGFFKFDCVGYVEAVFEDKDKGLNIDLTPNNQESGLGIPLTVREQRDSPNVVDVK